MISELILTSTPPENEQMSPEKVPFQKEAEAIFQSHHFSGGYSDIPSFSGEYITMKVHTHGREISPKKTWIFFSRSTAIIQEVSKDGKRFACKTAAV